MAQQRQHDNQRDDRGSEPRQLHEYFYEDVGGGEDVLFVNAFTAVRGMHIVHADFTGLHSYPDLQPHSRDISDYGAMTPDAKFMLGTREVNQVTATTQYNFNAQYLISQAPMGHAPDGTL